ncbi:MAG: NusG domain II-containing protein [Oscillospiraceae bacterium]
MSKTNKITFIIVAFILVLSLLSWVAFVKPSNDGSDNIAVLIKNNEIIMDINLTKNTKDQKIFLNDDYGIPGSLEIRENKIRFVDVSCPDKICEKAGFIGNKKQSAICIPNELVLNIK